MTHETHWITTEDGSLSWADARSGECFHNRAGALSEALCHFAWPAFLNFQMPYGDALAPDPSRSDVDRVPSKISRVLLLDICFGLGYNTWAFCALWSLFCPNTPLDLTVYALDAQFPNLADFQRILRQPVWASVPESVSRLISQLSPLQPNPGDRSDIETLSLWDKTSRDVFSSALEHNTYYQTLDSFQIPLKTTTIKEGFFNVTLHWLEGDLRETLPMLAQAMPNQIDAIFYDGFSPGVQPELWTLARLADCKTLLRPNGLWSSYCSASAVRGALRQLGFLLYETPPLGGKRRGGSVARNSTEEKGPMIGNLRPLTSLELDRLDARAGVPYREATTRQEMIRQRELEQAQMPEFMGK